MWSTALCPQRSPTCSLCWVKSRVCCSRLVIMKCWKISLRSEFRDTKPGEYKESHQDFLDDSTTQFQIGIVFGQSTLEYVLNLCRGNIDFLERLPEPLVLYIAKFLDLEDIAQLSQVSRTLEKICNSEKLWERIVESSCDQVTPEMRSLAVAIGWKSFFFTNKLQLQLKLRRRKKGQQQSH
ncbi:F-box only protein 36 isoform X2 [Ascaphus truei]|uniref:F-box only protein 36 isoform X2 n=1 Tax=Ascaphus truei TaxID=8439 RepID=UPI003F593B93